MRALLEILISIPTPLILMMAVGLVFWRRRGLSLILIAIATVLLVALSLPMVAKMLARPLAAGAISSIEVTTFNSANNMSKKETLHIYIRCSTDKQIDNSVERQKKLGLEYSKKMNKKSKLWIDGGKSRFGGLDKRDKMSELITEVQLGDVNHIWVEDWSRLTGEVEGTLEIEMYVLNGDVRVYEGLRGNMEYRPDNVMERSFQYLKTMMGSQVKKDEIKKSIQTKIDLFQKGYYMKGDPPFGFKLVDR